MGFGNFNPETAPDVYRGDPQESDEMAPPGGNKRAKAGRLGPQGGKECGQDEQHEGLERASEYAFLPKAPTRKADGSNQAESPMANSRLSWKSSPTQPFGVLTLPELELACAAEGDMDYIVESLIPSESVIIAVGDSGLGKSPLFYQMGMCVATGKPFLGLEVQQGGVLYLDFENGLSQINHLSKHLGQHLGLGSLPKEFRVWSYGTDGQPNLYEMVKGLKPKLVIVDSLRTYDPDAELRNHIAGKLIGDLHRIAKEHGCAITLVHHTRKPGPDGPPSLEKTPAVSWLNQASGARALINQTDVRLGIDLPEQGAGKADLVVKGFARLRGGIGPLYLARDYDDQGDPLGYRLRKGPELLFNKDQEAAFSRLPNEFTTKEAKQIYGREDQATSDFLRKCGGVGILRKDRRGHFVKVSCNGAE